MAQNDEKQQAQQAAQTRSAEDLKQNEGYRYEPILNRETGQVESRKITFKVDPKTGLEAK